MQDVPLLNHLRVPKWPFLTANGLLLGLAYFLFYWQAKLPLSLWEVLACCVCVGLGCGLGVLPYVLEYRAVIKHGALIRLIELSSLGAATEKIQNLEGCAAQIAAASDQLQTTRVQTDKTVAMAEEINTRMAQELTDFKDFLQRTNDGEKATLRLESEKLRRAEGDWLNVVIFTLDHIFALNRAAERSGQENLIRQIGQFQSTCRDVARRVGVSPTPVAPGERFDSQKHQLVEGDAPVGAVVGEVVGCGYSYQGRIIRRAVVKLQPDGAASAGEVTAESEASPDPESLPRNETAEAKA
jgi:molecular chaperone GrpE (heat shock protein)